MVPEVLGGEVELALGEGYEKGVGWSLTTA